LRTLEEYLALQYRVNVVAEPEGGYFIDYPDLPGYMSQAETLEEAFEVATEIRQLWITAAYEDGFEIPLPSYSEELSGKFNLRLPKSLHRRLVDTAEEEGVSLNQLVVSLLSDRVDTRELWARIEALTELIERLPECVSHTGVPIGRARYSPVSWGKVAFRQSDQPSEWDEAGAGHAIEATVDYSEGQVVDSDDDATIRERPKAIAA